MRPRYPWQARLQSKKKGATKSSLYLYLIERTAWAAVRLSMAAKFKIDICKIAVIMVGDERRHSLFDRPSKAARLRLGARVVAIESDRFSNGTLNFSLSLKREIWRLHQ